MSLLLDQRAPRIGEHHRLRSGLMARVTTNEDLGQVEAIVGMTGSADNSHGEEIATGAISASLATYGMPKGVASHDWSRDVARTLEAEELASDDPRMPPAAAAAGASGVRILGRYNLDADDIDARQEWSRVKFFGPDQEWSIGFLINKFEIDVETDTVRFTDIWWTEWSRVLVGADPNTVTLETRSRDAGEGDDAEITEAKDRYLALFGDDIATHIDDFEQMVAAARAANSLGSLNDVVRFPEVEPSNQNQNQNQRMKEIWQRRATIAAMARN